jgi:hypothetical protein
MKIFINYLKKSPSPSYSFAFCVFFFLFLNLFYNQIMTSLGFGYPRTSFFFYPQDIFADFFKFIINQNNLSQHFTVAQGEKGYPYITPHLNFSHYYPTNATPTPAYSLISGVNAIFLKLLNPYLVYFLNILLFLIIFFFQIKNFLVDQKISCIIFITSVFSYAVLVMMNRGHVYSAFTCLILIQVLINCYLKKNFILNFFLVLLAFSSKPTALCFALYIFYYNISFYKKIIYFFLLLVLAPVFYILVNEFNYFFLGNIWSFYNNFENTFKMHSQPIYYNKYIIGDAGLAFGSSLWGLVKIFLRSFSNFNPHIWIKITFLFCSLIFLIFTLLFFLKKINISVFTYTLVSYYILVSPISADYHLIVFFGPLLLLLKDYENSNNKDLYIVLILTIAFIVSPQHYYFTEKFIPEKTILNPLLILCTNFYILIKTNYTPKKIQEN